MATLGEFGSLLQLGFGIGVGLSVFRAPMERRARSLEGAIEAQLGVVKGVRTAKAQDRTGKLASLKLSFVAQRRKLNRFNLPLLWTTVGFAILNLGALIWASLDAAHRLTASERNILLFVAVGSYALLLASLECIAAWLFRNVSADLKSLSSKK